MNMVLFARRSKRQLPGGALLTMFFIAVASQLHPQDVALAHRTSVYDIQFTTDPGGDSPYVGQTVTISGVTTAAFLDGYTIAEDSGPWHSIFVFSKRNAPALGDSVQVTGMVKEYNGLTEIVDVSAFRAQRSNKRIGPYAVTAETAADEQYESVLVRIVDATVTGLDSYGEWDISDRSGSVRCDDKNDYMFFPKLGDHLDSVTGILLYDDQQFKLEPRFTQDIDCSAVPHYAIQGDVVTMNRHLEMLRNACLEIWGDRIINISTIPPAGIPVYHVDGFIFPGLIDAHNHPQWDVLDKIPFERIFTDRYEWQSTDLYQQVRDQFSEIVNYGGVDAQQANLFKLAEVRALCSGTTTIQGFNCREHQFDSFAREGIGINNAERFPGLIYSDVFPLSRDPSFWSQRSNEYWKRFAIHLAEGSSEAALQEFSTWRTLNMLDSRTVIIHGVPLRPSEFSEMARVGAHLVWSPSSNWLLYGTTADIPGALASGVNIALAPDWTESGMPNLLAELKFAARLNDKLWGGRITARQLVSFVTRNAALALGLETRIGSIAPGMNADVVVIPKLCRDPYIALLSTEPADVELTVVNGRPMYGDPVLINSFPFLEGTEDIIMGGRAKKIALSIRSHAIDGSDKPLSAVMSDLSVAYEASYPKICGFLQYDSNSSSLYRDLKLFFSTGFHADMLPVFPWRMPSHRGSSKGAG